jgi:regulator of protease activity HflC (stomatin/prohibitin superfamily)
MQRHPRNNPRRAVLFGLSVLVVLGGLVAAWDSWYVVEAGERAVTFSRTSGELETHDQGLHFKMPLLTTVQRYNVRGVLFETTAWGASRDLQDVHAEVAIQYHPTREAVEWLHREYGVNYADVVLAPAVQEVVKATTAKYNADQLISERVEVKAEIVRALRERMEAVNVVLKEVDIKDFDFSESFNSAIEAKVTAQQRALEEYNRLEQTRYQALGAEAAAAGRANATRIEAQAQADSARIISEQLSQGPRYIDYLRVQKWNGELPRYVGGEDGGMNLLVNGSE